jgi:tRNA A-37 threonylcarbamoyl transferase component Bud32
MPSLDPEDWGERVRDLFRRSDPDPKAGDPPVLPAPGESPPLSRFEIQGPLGHGATSTVYRARDRVLGRPVALKVLREFTDRGEVARERFRREARTAAKLSHPNLVTVFDAGEENGWAFLVMELIEGRPLSESMPKPGADRTPALRLLERAARGVAAAHGDGIVHRDLKPQNILVTAAGEPKVGDFGLAHLAETRSDLTKTGTTLGTPLYMAPEQVEGKPELISPRTDVYALGAILYEILAGRPPHLSEVLSDLYARILGEEPAAPGTFAADVHPDLETIALKALDKDPSRRYANAGEFADDLRRHLEGEPIHARPPSLLRRWGKAIRRRRTLAVSVGAAALGAIVVLSVAVPALRSGRQREEQARQAISLWGRVSPLLAEGERFLDTGDTAGARRRLDAAINSCRELLAREDLPDAHYLLGRLLEARGRSEEASRELLAAGGLDASALDAQLGTRLRRWPKDAEVVADADVSRYQARPERVWVVAPGGTSRGDGTESGPLSLEHTVGLNSPARPGDHILLRQGTYRLPPGGVEVHCSGDPERPIILRPFGSERPVVDVGDLTKGKAAFLVKAANFWLTGLDFVGASSPLTGDQAVTTSAVDCLGERCKVVNCTFQGLRVRGIVLTKTAKDSELYGNILLNNGPETTPPHYAYYPAGLWGVTPKEFNENIVAGNRSGYWQVFLHSMQQSASGLYRVSGNIVIGPAAVRVDLRLGETGKLIYSENLHFEANALLLTPPSESTTEFRVSDNFFVRSDLQIGAGSAAGIVTGNTFRQPKPGVTVTLNSAGAVTWDRNTYYYPFRATFRASPGLTWDQWREQSRFDPNSRLVDAPTGAHVVIRPNKFEPGRAHVAVFAWDRRDAVELDLSAVLKPGDPFEVHRLEDLRGSPVRAGTFTGTPVPVPLQQGREFQVFLVRPPSAP